MKSNVKTVFAQSFLILGVILSFTVNTTTLHFSAQSFAQDSAPTLRSLTDRARAFHQAGALNEAITTYQQALNLSPDNAPLKNEYARVLFQVGRLSDAKSMLESALPSLTSNQEKAKAWDYMGRIHENQQHIPQAVEAYRTSLSNYNDPTVQAKLNAINNSGSATSGSAPSGSAPSGSAPSGSAPSGSATSGSATSGSKTGTSSLNAPATKNKKTAPKKSSK